MSIVLLGATSFVIALSGALVPGPLFTITVSESVKRGFIAGPLIILGHGILEFIMILLLIFGITPFLTKDSTRFVVSFLGGVILIVMGVMLLRDARIAQMNISVAEQKKSLFGPIVAGVVGSLANPYWTIWWVTIGLGYLVSSLQFGLTGVTVFFMGHVAADLVWYSMLSYAVSRGRTIVGNRGYRYLLYSCGGFLILFGVWFITGML